MEIQIPYKCKNYTKNENMNKTCIFAGIEKMCKIYHDEICNEYKEKEDETCNNNSISDYNGSNSNFYSVFE